MVNGNVPLPHGGGAMGSSRPGISPSLHRRFASSPKLTQPIVANKIPWNRSPPSSAGIPNSSRAPSQALGRSTGTAKMSTASSASNYIRKEQRQKAELYGTLPKRKTQSQSSKPGRELPKIPTDKKSSLVKEEKKISRTTSVDKTASNKKISQSSVQSNDENNEEVKDVENANTVTEDSIEKVREDKSVASSRKTSTVVDLDNVPVPASLSRQDERISKANSRSTSPGGTHMERDSLSPEPKEYYKFTQDKDVCVNHTGKTFDHMDIVRHGYNAFFSIQKTSPFDVPPQPKLALDENFNNIKAEAEKIADSLENTREKTPSVVDEGRKSQSRASSVADRNSTEQNRSRNVSATESSGQVQSRAASTIGIDEENRSRTTSVAESRHGQTPQRSRSRVSGVNDEKLEDINEVSGCGLDTFICKVSYYIQVSYIYKLNRSYCSDMIHHDYIYELFSLVLKVEKLQELNTRQ